MSGDISIMFMVLSGFAAFFTILPIVLYRQSRRPSLKRIRELLKALKAEFGFEVVESGNPLEHLAKGKCGPVDVLVEFISRKIQSDIPPDKPAGAETTPFDQPPFRTAYSLRISLSEPALLPRGLLITKGKAARDDGPVPLAITDLARMNEAAGREIFDKETLAAAAFFQDNASAFHASATWIDIELPYLNVTSSLLRNAVASGALLAERFTGLNAKEDLYLAALVLGQGRLKFNRARRDYLLKHVRFPHYRSRTESLLKQLLDAPDFLLAVTAAEGLHLDLLEFITERIERYSHGQQEAALEVLLERRPAGAAKFLCDYFRKTGSCRLKCLILNGLIKESNPLCLTLFVSALADAYAPVRSLAVDAVAEHRPPEAVGPLYQLIQDPSQPRTLRDKARLVYASITSSLPATGSGELSLAGSDMLGGNLSIDTGTGNQPDKTADIDSE